MNIESYIKDLNPELQEKALTCSNAEELLALARENKIPVPDEVLAAIAGGGSTKTVINNTLGVVNKAYDAIT